MLRNNKDKYGLIAVLFHWSMFLIFVCAFALSKMMENMEVSPDLYKTIGQHKSFGVVFLTLLIGRFAWRIFDSKPESFHEDEDKALALNASVYAMYVLMLLVPLSGIIMSQSEGLQVSAFGYFEVPKFVSENDSIAELATQVHTMSANILFALVLMHVAGSIYHQVIEKKKIMKRIFP